MGYTTNFHGSFGVTPCLRDVHKDYLIRFAQTRRVKRDVVNIDLLRDEWRVKAGLPAGDEGGYYVGSENTYDEHYNNVIDSSCPPKDQPGLWCQWIPSDDGRLILHDGGEKFYNYIEWIQYLIKHFFKPWGYTLNGEVKWSGEDREDYGKIVIASNVVSVYKGEIVYTKKVSNTPFLDAEMIQLGDEITSTLRVSDYEVIRKFMANYAIAAQFDSAVRREVDYIVYGGGK